MSGETFRNTPIGDILEALNILHYSSNFQPQVSSDNHLKEAEGQVLTEDHKNEPDIENPTQNSSIVEPDPFLVSWNGSDDAENPQNWKFSRKALQITILMFLTTITYAGATIYSPGQPQLQQDFHVGHVAGTLPLSIYIAGYGLGTLFLSPMSELAQIGRTRIYLVTLVIFCVFQMACASVNNIGGMIVLRFISGFASSPALASVGASIGDMVQAQQMLLAIGAWANASIAAPAFAPLLGAAMSVAVDWRFIFWFCAILTGALSVISFLFMKESSHSNVLHRRAKRVRKELNDNRYYTEGEKEEAASKLGDFLFEITFRPMIIQFSEPGVFALNMYTALCYGSFYLFFESFPIVFGGIYHFTPVEFGLAFLGFPIGSLLGYWYLAEFRKRVLMPRAMKGQLNAETMLLLPLSISLLYPASVIFFGWTAQVHWILPIISELFFLLSVYNIFQGVFGYLTFSYPRYLASVYASNSFMRAAFGCSFPLFGTAMFNGMATKKYPVGWGCTLIAFFGLFLTAVSYYLYRISPRLKAKSKYAN